MDKDDVKKIVESVSENLKSNIMTAYDQIKMEGKIEGKKEGKKEVITNLIIKYPKFSNAQIAEIANESTTYIEEIRKQIQSKI